MSNIREMIINNDIESLSIELYQIFGFCWKTNLSSPFSYSDTIRSITKKLMNGLYCVKCLSGRQIYCVSNHSILPNQLQLALRRKEKYSKVTSSIDEGENTRFNIFDLIIVRDGKILLASLKNGVFVKIYNEDYLGCSINESKQLIDDYDRINSQLGIKTYTYNHLLFVLEPRAQGFDFSNFCLDEQEHFINSLALKHHHESCGNFALSTRTYEKFKDFALCSYNELDSTHSRLFKTSVGRNFSDIIHSPFRLSHRDFAAHNLLIKNQIIPIDLSPLKIGYAPSWYDTLTLMITESSEYQRHDLIVNFIEGYNSNFIKYNPVFSTKSARVDGIVFNILFMSWLPFKITLERVTSWTNGFIQYL